MYSQLLIILKFFFKKAVLRKLRAQQAREGKSVFNTTEFYKILSGEYKFFWNTLAMGSNIVKK